MQRGSTVGLTGDTRSLHCFDEKGMAFERTD